MSNRVITEKGTLPVGVEYEGKLQREFELRPQLVRDSIELLEGEHAERANKNDAFYGVCLLTRQIGHLGDIPKEAITPELIMDMAEEDFKALFAAKAALEARLRSFRGPQEDQAETGDGTA